MSELRWILIGFGIVLLAAIYLWGRRGQARESAPEAQLRARPEPSLEGEPHLAGSEEGSSGPDETLAPAWEDPQGRSVQFRPIEDEARPAPVLERDRGVAHEGVRERREPTFGEADITEELPARREPAVAAPTLSSSDAPPPRRIERRKILSVRLSLLPQRVPGDRLLECLLNESLEHGKYSVFHRLHTDGQAVFSVASMVEPGTFDPETMSEVDYPGVTLFAQLPGPVPGMHALNELIACARRLQQALGGTLQDERGVPLTVHRIERMRQEVREFERPGRAPTTESAHP
ncbi:MAG TPA: cell division protein ZipA C-terminal FtsZ-binding domain-containing protein [Steroidobacter sp.]